MGQNKVALCLDMVNYSALTTALVRETRTREAVLGLMEQTHSQLLLQPGPSSKVCLFFHGFTATPSQFLPMGETFFQMGYNVLVPLLPGHGLAGNWNNELPPPLPEDPQVYQQFGLYWLRQAQALGQQVIVGGLSGGGTLAAWLTLECPHLVSQALLFAPYLSNTNLVLDWFVQIFNGYFKWRTKPGKIHFGYDGFRMPALEAFLQMGRAVLDQAEMRLSSPLLIVSSESDRAVDNRDHQKLFEVALRRQPKSWYYCFDRTLQVPHTMLTKVEGNNHQDWLIEIVKAYVESDLTWAQVKQICDRVRQGKSFDQAVCELGLNQQFSADIASAIKTLTSAPTGVFPGPQCQ